MAYFPARRRFLKHSAALAASATMLGTMQADEKKKPPSERLNLGIIGCGAGSQGDYNLSNVISENIVALCDVDSDRAGKARQAHPKAAFYQNFHKLLDHKGVDAVVISTPDHMHAIPAVLAMQAGKALYCEKPLAHTVHEIRVMMETAAKNKLVTQMGTQIHAGDNYRRVVEIVQAGVIGPVSRVHVWCAKRPDTRKLAAKPVKVPASLDYDLWLGPAPERPYDPAFLPFHWRWWWDFGGGILADMACHFMDLPHWALDLRTPTTVAATGKKIGEGDHDVPDILQVDYQYPARGERPAVHLTWYSGCVGPDLRAKEPFHGFANGVLFEGEKGQLVADYGNHKLLPEAQFKDFKPPKETIPRSVGHHKEWIEAVKAGGTTSCNFGYSGALAETVLLGNVAFRSGKKISWNDKEGTVDSPEASKYLQREYRKGWKLG
ncbi:MAG: Gfo/Idh/MocA family protein [Gemmataceae bacterium]